MKCSAAVFPGVGSSVCPSQFTRTTAPPGRRLDRTRSTQTSMSGIDRKYRISENTIKSKRYSGHDAGICMRWNRTCGWSAHRGRAACSGCSTISTPTKASQRWASMRVRTPIEHPSSSPAEKRRSPRASNVRLYLSVSYALVSKPHGSGFDW